ncbi:DUF445 domain-containing protein [Shewanella sp. OPT22]|nr:DUF445 domain-containing protein [Shewanella sp. OPT22]
MNKSFLTNLIAVIAVIVGYVTHQPLIWSVGIFALSGAITNWLAIYMLFEKVPGLYGSGVVPARFEEFKVGIKSLVMEQFFTQENIERFVGNNASSSTLDFAPIVKKIDLSPSFDALLKTIESSSFGGMLAMFGGTEALIPLKEPFIEKLQGSLVEVSESEQFKQLVLEEIEQPDNFSTIREQVETIVEQRLNELTPKLVKEIVQTMIQKHLGWLVVWGGVFGGLIGLVAALIK